jgi:hypothetical protein
VTELYVAEQYWPTGEPADSLRTMMLGWMLLANQGNKEAAKSAQKIWRKLSGQAGPALANKKGMSAEEIKRSMKGLI